MAGIAGPRGPVGKYGQPVVPNLAVRHLCPNCQIDPPNIIEEYSHGDLVCADCGTILGDRIVDTRSEWRTFAGDEGGDDPSRVGGPSNPLLANQPLETSISARDGRTGMSRDLQRAQSRANQQANGPGKGSNPAQRQAAWARIAELCDAMQLPRAVIEGAQHAYKVGDEMRAWRGKSDEVLMCASIILAGRALGAPRSFLEVAKVAKVQKAELGKVFQALKKAVGKSGVNIEKQNTAEQSAEGLLTRFVNYLDLGTAVFNAAKYITAAAVAKAPIDGRSPLSIAAGVLYFTCILFEKSTSSKEIARVAGVSDSTIKLITKKVSEDVDAVIRPEWAEKFPTGYANLVSLGKANKASRSGTPANGKDKDSEMEESKDEPQENEAGSKAKENGKGDKDKGDKDKGDKGDKGDKSSKSDKGKDDKKSAKDGK